MINEEAIKILKTLIPKTCKMVNGRLKGGFDNTDCPEYNAIQTAINVIEKQIPKNPSDDFSTHATYDDDGNYLEQLDTTTFKCPICNHTLASGEINKTDCVEIHYCENCGQALDWR